MSGASRNRKGKQPPQNVHPLSSTQNQYDGPGSAAGTSASGSVGRAPDDISVQSRQAGSSAIRSGSYGAPGTTLLSDPARDHQPRAMDALRMMDMPASCYNLDSGFSSTIALKKRPGFNTSGKEINLAVNSYLVTQLPDKTAYQYDVVIGNGIEKPAIIKKVWNSQARKQYVPNPILFDGNKLAWALYQQKKDVSFVVNLDAEQGRTPRPGDRDNSFRVTVRFTKRVNMALVDNWVQGKISFSSEVIEALGFLQHLIREGPEANPAILSIRNKFFTRDGQRADIGGAVEVFRGIFQSMRPTHPGRMTVNLDVANTCFWRPMALHNLILNKFKKGSVPELGHELRPKKNIRTGEMESSKLFPMLKIFRKLRVTPDYPGCKFTGREFQIKEFIEVNAKEHYIDYKDPATGEVTKNMTIYDYFRRRYNVTLIHWNWPLCQMTRPGVFYPVEVLTVVPNQKYNYRLDEFQTANMIKFAVSRPDVRMKAINEGKGWLNWQNDRPMAAFGMKIKPDMIVTKARLLPNPKIQFGGSQVDPGTQGRWDLRGRKFLTPNPQELVAWGIACFSGRIRFEKLQIEQFAQALIKQYRAHGGRVSGALPLIINCNSDPALAVQELFMGVKTKYKADPQLLVYLVQNKDAFHYLRIKKSSDCRFGVVSQVLQMGQVLKSNPQYLSNVLMKVNAKLGGCTASSISPPNSGFKALKPWSMIIGADVSHPSPGSTAASTAALTVSMDRFGGRYAAAVQTNGVRVEMISEDNFFSMLKPIAEWWVYTVAGRHLPEHIYYFRDGVSEGQFQQVLQLEVPRIRHVMNAVGGVGYQWKGSITVVIASKRHHIRAFPNPKDRNAADRNGNPLPGAVIERDCTAPHDWDFYLYSHIALQGTSRPVHYTVIQDDGNHKPEFLMNMIYEHCYQYMRSTTSVSLHPAVYYAHLASTRAKSHEDVMASDGPRGGPGFKMKTRPADEGPVILDTKPLIPFPTNTKIHLSMWYI